MVNDLTTLLSLASRFIQQELNKETSKYCKWRIQPIKFFDTPTIFAQSPTTSIRIACIVGKAAAERFRIKEAESHDEETIGQARFVLTSEGILNKEDLPKGWQILIAVDANTIELPFPYYSIWDRPFLFRKRDRELEVDLFWLYETKNGAGLLPDYGNKPVKIKQAERKIKSKEVYVSELFKNRLFYDDVQGSKVWAQENPLKRLSNYNLENA
jgi:hypothetical protein